jgi:opacity protein-like surface antigen
MSLRENKSVSMGAQMWNLTNARSVGAKASSVRTSTRGKRKALILAGAVVASVAGGSNAWAQCNGAVVVALPGLPLFTASPLGLSGAATVNSIVSVLNTMNTAFLTQSTAFVSAPGNVAPDTNGGGVWSRGIGGRIDTDSTGTVGNFTVSGAPVLPGFSFDCNTKTRQEFAGYQIGADIARINLGGSGSNIHFGVTAGYAESKATDISPGGSFSGTFQVPFAGVYAAFTQGGLFVDGQLRFDFYQNSLTDIPNGLLGQEFNARGVSLTGNVGYQVQLGSGWFVEPSVGAVWSTVRVDALNVAGNLGGVLPAPPGTIQINDVESLLARASIRVGTNFTAGSLALQPFVTASVFHEFADNVTTSLNTCFGAVFGTGACGTAFGGLEVGSTLSSDRIGTYGQFALGIAGQLVNTGWLGYVRADYRTGEKIEGWSLNGGIRYQFTPDPVLSRTAGIYKAPVKAPLAGPIPVNWTGFYLGAHVGTLFARSEWTNLDGVVGPGGQVSPEAAGFLGGGQVGYNFQVGSWVFGIEGDGSGSTANGAKSCPNGFFATCHANIEWTATLAGRLGYSWDRTLFYAKGGAAFTEATFEGSSNVTGLTFATVTDNRVGWMAGAGFEYALTSNWSAKAEYNYMDFGTRNLTFSNGEFADIRLEVHAVKVGVNYRFGWTPASVIASY